MKSNAITLQVLFWFNSVLRWNIDVPFGSNTPLKPYLGTYSIIPSFIIFLLFGELCKNRKASGIRVLILFYRTPLHIVNILKFKTPLMRKGKIK